MFYGGGAQAWNGLLELLAQDPTSSPGQKPKIMPSNQKLLCDWGTQAGPLDLDMTVLGTAFSRTFPEEMPSGLTAFPSTGL